MTSTPTERHFEEAMDWLLRLDAAQADAALHAGHRAWLASDPLNALAWQQARKGWSVIGKAEPATMADWPPVPAGRAASGTSGQAIHLLHRRRHPAAWILAAAACLLLAVASVLALRPGADYATSTAEIRQVALVDGGSIRLAPESALSVSLTADGRMVTMAGGRAFFDVARDAGRPFVVRAGDVTITVLGTAFDVRMDDRAVAVAVRHGRVAVRPAGRVDDEYLTPGDRITISRATGEAMIDLLPDIAVGSWTDGMLSVLNAPAAEVIDEIRRYHPGWIIVADDRLATARITGLYNLQKPDLALKALLQPIGGTMHQVSPFLTILSMAGK